MFKASIKFVFFLVIAQPQSAITQGEQSSSKLYQSAIAAIYNEEYTLAESLLRQITVLDSRYQDDSGVSAWYQLGRVLEQQNRNMEAMRTLRQGLDSLQSVDRHDWSLKYNLARLYAEFDLTIYDTLITKLVYDVFKNSLPDRQPELWRQIIDQTQFLFKGEKRQQVVRSLTEEGSKPGLELVRFFRREDPSPLTEQNEYLSTFFKRSAEARKLFAAERTASGFDERGELYVRYGKPYSILSDHSGVQGPVGYKIYPYEFWFYKHINTQLYYTFIRPRGRSHFVLAAGPETVFNTAYRGRSTFGSRQRSTWRDRFRQDPRFGQEAVNLIENLYMRLAGQHETFRQRLNKLAELEDNEAKLSYANSMFELQDRDHVVQREAIAPTVIYKVGDKAKNLPISVSFNRFQDINDKIRTEIYYSVPYKELHFSEVANGFQAQLQGQIAIFNEEYELVSGDFIQERCIAPSRRDIQQGFCINQWNYLLDPGNYDVFISLEDTLGRRFEVVNLDLEVNAFPKDELALSDIQLASLVEESQDHPHSHSQFTKHGFLVVPVPSLTVNKDKSILLYFEIYKLALDKSGHSNYQIGYRVSSAETEKKGFLGIFGGKGKDESITLSDIRTGNSETQIEYITLDVQKFKTGAVNLEVIVTDLNSKQDVTSQVSIKLLD